MITLIIRIYTNLDIKDDNASAKKEWKSSDISTQKTFNIFKCDIGEMSTDPYFM